MEVMTECMGYLEFLLQLGIEVWGLKDETTND